MLRYTLRRIFLMVPTLIMVSLLAFALNECTPENVDDDPPREEGNTLLKRYDNKRKGFVRLARQHNADLPLFYVGIHSAAYPDTLRRIVPKERQKVARWLIGQHGNWPAIQEYQQAIEASIRTGLKLAGNYRSDALIEMNRLSQQLNTRYKDQDIQRNLRGMEKQLQLDSVLQQSLRPQVQTLQEAYNNLGTEQQAWKHYVPLVEWNGSHSQYHHWLSKILVGDFGLSRVSGQDVSERVGNALRWTLRLNISAFILAYLIAIPLGVYTAVYAGSKFDRRLNIFLFFIYALPSFWVATLLTQFLASPEWLDIFPSMGVGDIPGKASWWERSRIRIHHFFLPVFCLTYGILAVITRQVRTAMQAVLQSDYIRTARAQGLSEQRITWRHAFPNALFPLITMFGGLLPGVIAGSIIIELIFSIPGVGKLTLDSIYNKDWPIVYALLLLTAVVTVLGILLADILYAWADPRVKLANKNPQING